MNNPSIRLDDDPLQFDHSAVWKEIMMLIPRYLYPENQDRDACELLVASLISYGMSLLLDSGGKCEVIIAGLVVQTVLHVEAESRQKQGTCGETLSKK